MTGLFLRRSGDPRGVPVVLLHSLFFDGSMFEDLQTELQARGAEEFQFLVPDHRGQGRSPDGDPGGLALEQLAVDVAGFLKGFAPAHVVGSSMGGYVATHLAATRPELVVSCTLMGGTADAELDPAYFADLERALRAGGVDVVDRVEHTMFGDRHLSRAEDDPARTRWRRGFAALPPRVADAAHAVFTRNSLHAALAAVQAPLLLIAGEEDHAKPPVQMRRMAQARPDAHLEVLPGVGHTPAVENPGRVAELLLRHWSHSLSTTGPVHTSTRGNL